MYGSRPPRRTLLTAAVAVLALMLLPASSALAQSAGDRQYSDPLAEDDGRPAAPDPDTPTSDADPAAPAAPAAGAVDLPAGAEPSGSFADDGAPAETLPRTGADPATLALLGVAALALGAGGLALARGPRHARR